MITEDYISFDTAKLLKDKGFNEYCPLWYNLDKPIEGPFFYKKIGWYGHNSYDYNGKRIVSAPTLQMAMKWLREIHLILYIIYPNLESGELRFSWRIHKLEQDKKHYVENIPGIGEYYKDSDESFTTYKEAEESLIKYCLKHLI